MPRWLRLHDDDPHRYGASRGTELRYQPWPRIARPPLPGPDSTRPWMVALLDVLIATIGSRRDYCDWIVEHASWVVTLMYPEEHEFDGRTLAEGLAWCLVWQMGPELGEGPMLV